MGTNPQRPHQFQWKWLLVFTLVCATNLLLIRLALIVAVYCMLLAFVHLVLPDWFLTWLWPYRWQFGWSWEHREDAILRKYTRLFRIIGYQAFVLIVWALEPCQVALSEINTGAMGQVLDHEAMAWKRIQGSPFGFGRFPGLGRQLATC